MSNLRWHCRSCTLVCGMNATKITRASFSKEKKLFGRRPNVHVLWRQAQKFSVVNEINEFSWTRCYFWTECTVVSPSFYTPFKNNILFNSICLFDRLPNNPFSSGKDTLVNLVVTLSCIYVVLSSLFSAIRPVPADLRSVVYFYGMSQSGEKEWDIVFDRLQKTIVASERRKLMFGLAATPEPWLINR